MRAFDWYRSRWPWTP